MRPLDSFDIHLREPEQLSVGELNATVRKLREELYQTRLAKQEAWEDLTAGLQRALAALRGSCDPMNPILAETRALLAKYGAPELLDCLYCGEAFGTCALCETCLEHTMNEGCICPVDCDWCSGVGVDYRDQEGTGSACQSCNGTGERGTTREDA